MSERYKEVELDMAEAIVVQTIDTLTGEIVDEKTHWKPGFDDEDEDPGEDEMPDLNLEGDPAFNGAFKETR